MDTEKDTERDIEILRRRKLRRMGAVMLAVEIAATLLILDYGPVPDTSTLLLMLIPFAEVVLCSKGGIWSVLHDSRLAFAADVLMPIPLTLLMALLALNVPQLPLVAPILWFAIMIAWFLAIPLYWRLLRRMTV